MNKKHELGNKPIKLNQILKNEIKEVVFCMCVGWVETDTVLRKTVRDGISLKALGPSKEQKLYL